MWKTYLMLLIVAFLVGCSSSPPPPVNTSGVPLPAEVEMTAEEAAKLSASSNPTVPVRP